MIRHATEADLAALQEIADSTQMFLGDELDYFMDMMRVHFGGMPEEGAAVLVATDESDETVCGAAYFAPEEMAQGVVNLLFIGVLPNARGSGHGEALLAAFERLAAKASTRLAIIETASDEMFAPAWALYRRHGYEKEARVRDYYDDGLDKLIFTKRLNRA